MSAHVDLTGALHSPPPWRCVHPFIGTLPFPILLLLRALFLCCPGRVSRRPLFYYLLYSLARLFVNNTVGFTFAFYTRNGPKRRKPKTCWRYQTAGAVGKRVGGFYWDRSGCCQRSIERHVLAATLPPWKPLSVVLPSFRKLPSRYDASICSAGSERYRRAGKVNT